MRVAHGELLLARRILLLKRLDLAAHLFQTRAGVTGFLADLHGFGGRGLLDTLGGIGNFQFHGLHLL